MCLTQSSHSVNIYWIEIVELDRAWFKILNCLCIFSTNFLLWQNTRNIKFPFNHFYVWNSVVLKTFTLLYKHHAHPSPEVLHHPRRKLCTHSTVTPHSLIQQMGIDSFIQQRFNELPWLMHPNSPHCGRSGLQNEWTRQTHSAVLRLHPQEGPQQTSNSGWRANVCCVLPEQQALGTDSTRWLRQLPVQEEAEAGSGNGWVPQGSWSTGKPERRMERQPRPHPGPREECVLYLLGWWVAAKEL